MSVAKQLTGGLFTSISVANTGGGTAGVDFTVTLTERGTGTTYALAVTSGTTIGAWTATTPSGYFIKLTDRAPASTSSAVTYMTVQANDAPNFDYEAGGIAVGLNRVSGAFQWQGAPVILPSIFSGIVGSSSLQSSNVTSNYTGGTSAPGATQRYWGMTFAAGSTPPGTVIRATSWMNRTSGSGSMGIGYYGRNTAGGSTAVNLVRMTGANGNAAPQGACIVILNTNTNRSAWLDHTNSGGRGTEAIINNTDTNLNTNNEWALFCVRTVSSGTSTWVGAGPRIEILQDQVVPTTSFI